jgi:transcriptional repressor NrdR
MKCVFCGTGETEVVNSRKGKGESEVWRRRKCETCREIFTTSETFSYDSLFVIKRNLSRRRFVYEKLFASILVAITGGKGSDMGDDAVKAKMVARQIIQDLFLLKSKYVSTKDIIRAAYAALYKENEFFARKYAMYSEYRLRTVQGKK